MKRILAVGLVLGLILLSQVGLASVPSMKEWKVIKVQSFDSVVVRSLLSPAAQKGMTISLRGEIVYKEWQKDSQIRSAVKVGENWIEGEPLYGYALFENGKLVVFQMVKNEPEKYQFFL